MTMVRLVEMFTRMPGVEWGYGMRHPTHPDRGMKKYFREHLRKYPFLSKHEDFVEFLELCAGAWVDSRLGDKATDYWFTTLFGIGPWEMVDACSEAVDPEGFYEFAVSDIGAMYAKQDSVAIYGLDATGQRGNEVYAALRGATGADDMPLLPYCANFTEWLRRFVESEGRLLPVEICSLTGEK